ncbi:MAG: transglutaminase family protein [Hyphomicrobium sp.]|jgi:transglutaminase-like putative cysteine protease
MIYAIRQITAYSYGSYVPYAAHVLRLVPVAGPSLNVIECDLVIDPKPSEYVVGKDFFGNSLAHVVLKSPHSRLSVESRAVVELLEGPAVTPEGTPPWEDVRAAAHTSARLDPRSPAHQLFPTRHVPISPELLAYGVDLFVPGRPVLEAAIALMTRIRQDFEYDPSATSVSTPTVEALGLRRGVCQDFAHIMIGVLRSLGLPAGYVSGYLRTVPLPGKARLQGADAMHAWVSVWCGEEAGWQDLDPTNAVRAGRDHVPLAFGRDYADVSPIDGVIFHSGSHSLAVSVDVVER